MPNTFFHDVSIEFYQWTLTLKVSFIRFLAPFLHHEDAQPFRGRMHTVVLFAWRPWRPAFHQMGTVTNWCSRVEGHFKDLAERSKKKRVAANILLDGSWWLCPCDPRWLTSSDPGVVVNFCMFMPCLQITTWITQESFTAAEPATFGPLHAGEHRRPPDLITLSRTLRGQHLMHWWRANATAVEDV